MYFSSKLIKSIIGYNESYQCNNGHIDKGAFRDLILSLEHEVNKQYKIQNASLKSFMVRILCMCHENILKISKAAFLLLN